jgi:hypothetical protein
LAPICFGRTIILSPNGSCAGDELTIPFAATESRAPLRSDGPFASQSNRELGAGGWGKAVVRAGTHTVEQWAKPLACRVERWVLPASLTRSRHCRLSVPMASFYGGV